MVAGRELDALVAQKVMDPSVENEHYLFMVPHYSTDIGSAWKVVEMMSKQARMIQVEFLGDLGWEALIGSGVGNGETAPLAICLAALKAVEK